MTVAQLKSYMEDEAFERIVNQEARGQASPEIGAYLRSPAVVERWQATLLALKRSIEVQLIAKKAELAEAKAAAHTLGPAGKAVYLRELADYEKWRAGAIRVLAKGLEGRLAEAKRLRHEGHKDSTLRECQRLKALVLAHRDHMCGPRCSAEHCVANDVLWASIE